MDELELRQNRHANLGGFGAVQHPQMLKGIPAPGNAVPDAEFRCNFGTHQGCELVIPGVCYASADQHFGALRRGRGAVVVH